MPSLKNFVLVTDADVAKATYETRTDAQRARDLGGAIMESFRTSGRLARLDTNPKLRTPAMALLYAMCYELGKVEDLGSDLVGLVVRMPITEISVYLGWAKHTARSAKRLLEDKGLILAEQPREDIPEIFIVQGAFPLTPLHGGRAPSGGGVRVDRIPPPVTNPEQTRVGARPPRGVYDQLEHPNGRKVSFCTENPQAAQGARANSLYDDDDDDLNTTPLSSSHEDAEARQVFEVLTKKCGMWRSVAQAYARRISLIDAFALHLMLKDQPALDRPGGWCVERLKGGDITEYARNAARRLLAGQGGRSLFDPTPHPSACGDASGGPLNREGGDDDYRIG